MARDLYSDAEALAERLWHDGRHEWSDRLSGAIREGATASEILMALRYHLAGLLDSDADLDEATRTSATELHSSIDVVLGP